MNISHYPSDSNRATLVAAHVANQSQYITPDYFLPTGHSESYYSKQYSGNHTTNTINHHHAANTIAGIRPIYQSKSSKISRVASVMLLSFGFLATAVEVRAQPSLGTSTPTSSFAVQSPLQQQVRFQSSQQQPKKKSLLTRAAHKTAKRLGFSSGKPNSNTSTSPYTQTTESPYHKQAEISMEEWKELYTAEYGESMDATIGRGATGGDKTSGLAEALRKSLALREKILESRRAEDIFSKESIYSKPIDAISIASSSTQYEEPWQDPDALIGEAFEIEFSTSKKQQRFEPSAPPLSAYSSFSSGERIERRDIKLRQEELEAIELIDQAIEDSGYSNSISNSPTNEVGFRGGDDTDISNCLSSDTSSTEYDTEAEIRSYENVPLASQSKTLRTRNARNASSVGAGARYSYRDIEQGLASLQSDTDFSEECSDEESATTTNGYDTVYTSSSSEYSNDDNSEWDTDFSDDRSDKDELPTPPPEEEWAALGALVELDNTTEPTELSAYSKVSNPDEAEATDILEASDIPLSFTNQKMTKEVSVVADIKDITEDTQDESTAASVLEILDQKNTEEDNLPQDISANLRNTAIIEPQEQSTARDQEELLKKASTIASSSTQARQASKIASNHIKQRMFVRDMLVAVASGDESESDQSQILGYSVWSSGAFGSAKQKASNTLHGYRSKILGGTIGADINFENDLLVGSSFSKIRSNIKHASQKVTKKLNTYIASFYGSSLVKGNLTFGVIGSAGFSPKPRSKLLSLESHLHYKIALPQNVTLIPHIGFKYEYERSKTYQEQIGGNVSIARAKKSYQAISGEIGSRVIFAPIKLDANGTSNITLSKTTASTISITPTAHFSVERRIGSRGVNSPYHLTYQGNGGVGQEIGASTLSINPQHQKTSFNTGIGLIASLKNIKLELLYDHTRQKRFKSHQGVLKLKVNL